MGHALTSQTTTLNHDKEAHRTAPKASRPFVLASPVFGTWNEVFSQAGGRHGGATGLRLARRSRLSSGPADAVAHRVAAYHRIAGEVTSAILGAPKGRPTVASAIKATRVFLCVGRESRPSTQTGFV